MKKHSSGSLPTSHLCSNSENMYCIPMTFRELYAANFVANVWREAFLFLTVLKNCFKRLVCLLKRKLLGRTSFLVM